MTDLDGARVLEVKKGRDTQTVVSLWETMSPEQREKIVAAAMDIGGPYIAGTRQAVPHVDIVHDRFHVSKPLNEAVDHTRREEAADHTRREKAAKLAERGDYTLKCSRFMWLHGVVPEKQKDHFEALLKPICAPLGSGPTRSQWSSFGINLRGRGRGFFAQWYRSIMSSRLPKVKKVARTLKAHLGGLLTYFKHRITNALTEGFNSKIQAL